MSENTNDEDDEALRRRMRANIAIALKAGQLEAEKAMAADTAARQRTLWDAVRIFCTIWTHWQTNTTDQFHESGSSVS